MRHLSIRRAKGSVRAFVNENALLPPMCACRNEQSRNVMFWLVAVVAVTGMPLPPTNMMFENNRLDLPTGPTEPRPDCFCRC